MQNYPKNVPEIVREANIVYDSTAFQTGHPYVPLLVSNGIVGACFDHMGFQSTPTYDYPQGRTVFGYIRHYEMDETSRQIQFPLAVIQAEFADESSFWPGWHMNKSDYFPMYSLFMQGFNDMLVQDWRGYLDLFACVFDSWKKNLLLFRGLERLVVLRFQADGIMVK